MVIDVYTYGMKTGTPGKVAVPTLFELPCACQNLRRATRVVTRIYDQELAKAGIEITQFGLLTALDLVGEANKKNLSGRLCHGQYDADTHAGAAAEAGLGARAARKRPAGAAVQPD